MDINSERQHVLNKFPQKYRQHILDFSKNLTNLDVDILIFTARKAACFFHCLEYLRLWDPGNRVVTTDRLIDHDTSWIKGKRIAIIDEVIVSGTSLKRLAMTLTKAGASEITIHALFINKEWFVSDFFKNDVLSPSYIALDGPDAQALGTTIVRAFYGIPRPYSIDYPMSGRNTLGKYQTDSLAFLPGWRQTQIEEQWAYLNDRNTGDRLDFFRFEPDESTFKTLSVQIGIEVAYLSLVKVRTYGKWERTNESETYNFRVVPYLVLNEQTVTEVDAMFEQVVSACIEKNQSALTISCLSNKARLRLIQYIFASRLGKAWAKNLQDFGINVSFVEDQREISFIFPVSIHDAVAELCVSTKLQISLPPIKKSPISVTQDDLVSPKNSSLSTFQYLHLSKRFLSFYLDEEIPARQLAKKLGEKYFDQSTPDRLNRGLTVDELSDWAKSTSLNLSHKQLSTFVDIAVDSGIVVPITVERNHENGSKTISRAYRHGEETYILQRDLGLFHLMLTNVADDVNKKVNELGVTSTLARTNSLTKILLEKILVLFVRFAIAKSIFPRVYADSDDRDPSAVLVGIGYDLFGARVAVGVHKPTGLPYQNTFVKWLLDTRILHDRLDHGYEINASWPNPFSKPDKTQQSEIVQFSEVVASAVVHLVDKAGSTSASSKKMMKTVDRIFVTLTTCESEASTLMAIGAELRRFDKELEHLGVIETATIDLQKLVQEKSFVEVVMAALNSGFMKLTAYINDEAARNSRLVSEALTAKGKIYGAVWEDIWDAAKRDQSAATRDVLYAHLVGAVEVLLKGLLLTHWARSIALQDVGASRDRVAAALKSMHKKAVDLDELTCKAVGHDGLLTAVTRARRYHESFIKRVAQDRQGVYSKIVQEFAELRVLARDQFEWIDAVTADDGRIARLVEYDSVVVILLGIDERNWHDQIAQDYVALTSAAVHRFRSSSAGPRAYLKTQGADPGDGMFLMQPVRFRGELTILSFLAGEKRGITYLGYLIGECVKLTDSRRIPLSASVVLGLENSRKIHKNSKTGEVVMPTTARALVLAGQQLKPTAHVSITTICDSASKFDYLDALKKEVSISVKRNVQSTGAHDVDVSTAGGSFKVESFLINQGTEPRVQEVTSMNKRVGWVVIVEDEGAPLLFELEQLGIAVKTISRGDGKIIGESILPTADGSVTLRIFISSGQGNTPIGNLLSNIVTTETIQPSFIVVSGICCSLSNSESLTKVAIPTSVLDLQLGVVTNDGTHTRAAGPSLATKPLQLVKWYLMHKGKRKLSTPGQEIDQIKILDNAIMVADNLLLKVDDPNERHRVLARNYSDKAVAYDMETAGVVNWGQENPHFPAAVVIKGLSDFGYSNKTDDDNRTIAAKNAMKISLDFIRLSIEHTIDLNAK